MCKYVASFTLNEVKVRFGLLKQALVCYDRTQIDRFIPFSYINYLHTVKPTIYILDLTISYLI